MQRRARRPLKAKTPVRVRSGSPTFNRGDRGVVAARQIVVLKARVRFPSITPTTKRVGQWRNRQTHPSQKRKSVGSSPTWPTRLDEIKNFHLAVQAGALDCAS